MKTTCEFPGCANRSRCRGWCDNHYRKWLRCGDPSGTGKGRPRAADATYNGVHLRLKYDRGAARDHSCPCGRPAQSWSYDRTDPDQLIDERERPYSLDLSRYQPLCWPCHNARDRAARLQERGRAA